MTPTAPRSSLLRAWRLAVIGAVGVARRRDRHRRRQLPEIRPWLLPLDRVVGVSGLEDGHLVQRRVLVVE